jgi:hypothetical protein
MAETFFLSSLAAYLDGAGLAPTPAAIGVAEPAQASDLPAIVLSLESTARANPGIGGRAQLITDGVLPWQARIDLANPFLPDEPDFSLVDATRRLLILPHGGLVRQDGSDPGDEPLEPADITVTVDGGARTVVSGAPGPLEVRADGGTGTLTFGAALPASGVVVASYVLGQWEQRLERIAGTLRMDACAADADAAGSLSDAAMAALLDPSAARQVRRLIAISPLSLGTIGLPEPAPALRRRTARFAFTFEQEVNRPDSSGGIIRRLPVTARMGDGLEPPGVVAGSIESFAIPT